MDSIEIKIFGQSFLINPPEGKKQFYADVACKLDRMITDECNKPSIRSEVRAAIRVAFILAAENAKLKADLDKSLEVVKRIDNRVDSFGA